MHTPWDIWIDTGGTFTDCVARDPAGVLHRAKVLSSAALRGRVLAVQSRRELCVDASWLQDSAWAIGASFHVLDGPDAESTACVVQLDHRRGVITLDRDMPGDFAPGTFELRTDEPAPIVAARLVTGTALGCSLPPAHLRLATTRGTNALLERRGSPTALLITVGFGDLLTIGDQRRPDLFALNIVKDTPLPETVIEVPQRMAADGSIVTPLDLDRIRPELARLRARGIETAAVALLHSYRNPEHEHALAAVLRDVGFTHVSCSSDQAALIRILDRAQTAVVDAYLSPVVGEYLEAVREHCPEGGLHVMTSAGGLVRADRYAARDSLLSGPAGGVTGMAMAGRRAGLDRVIGLDMGGTSTDVARFAGDYEYQFEHTVGGVSLLAPALAIETVAAGGGSICHFTENRLRVGPESASADPGPACYGAGGPLTLTDVNLLLGRLDPNRFGIPISSGAAKRACDALLERIYRATDVKPDREAVLEGLLTIADERMADAITEVSVRRGYDPRDFALVAFGGAGPQHACAVAERLGMPTILMPADASLLSAVGLGHATIERFAHTQVLRALDDVEGELPQCFGRLAHRAITDVADEGVPRDDITIRRRIVNARLLGQETSISLDIDDVAHLREQFTNRFTAMYGYAPTGKPIEIESVRVIASATSPPPPPPPPPECPSPPRENTEQVPVCAERFVRARFDGEWHDVPAFERGDLREGASLAGPALVFDPRTAYVIHAGWRATVDGDGSLLLRISEDAGSTRAGPLPGVVQEELFANRFTAIAREMGEMLRRTAVSTNVKERLDFSCALLDAKGHLVVNAPHIPVHLGALGLCVRALPDAIEMGPGDVVVTNHPGFGGSHLPDVTLVAPVHGDDGQLLGYVANRAHHAELGGTRPGSMPPDATCLAEEGVVFSPMYLRRGSAVHFDEVEAILRRGPHPSRAVDDNLADLRAQLAACLRGVESLQSMALEHGAEAITSHMSAITTRAARLTHAALGAMDDGTYEAEEHLDDRAPLHVCIEIAGDCARVDFTGSAPIHPGNLNATPAIVTSAVMYVLRLLTGERLPLNEGILDAVDLTLPCGMLNPVFVDDPRRCPAVVGGNVETSQCIVDTLIKALGLSAGSQGTMNNVLFGNDQLTHYETVCGGCGAGPTWAGADAVHSHMTNTRITDPEVLETRFPVRLERFAVRAGSGGQGRYAGGAGAVREYQFLAPMTLSLMTQHRSAGPFGVDGGAPGEPGAQIVIRADESRLDLGACDGCEMAAGDRLILRTPGGGGWGNPR